MFKYTFFSLLLLLNCSHDYEDHILIDDEEINHAPAIALLTTDSKYNIVIHLSQIYSDQCAFFLERKTNNGVYMVVPIKIIDGATIMDTTIDKENNANFDYRLKIKKDKYETDFSEPVPYQYSSHIIYPPIDFYIYSIELQGVGAQWKDISQVEEGYIIERNDGNGYDTIAILPANREFYFDDAIPNEPAEPMDLSYRITAYQNTRQSIPVTKRMIYSGIGSPVNLRISQYTTTTCTLGWSDRSQMETGFIVERKKDSGTFQEIKTLNANDTVYTDTVSTIGDYIYRIRAVKNSLYSSYSNEAQYSNTAGYFMDTRDGRWYKTVNINGKTWMAENLNYETYSGSWYYNNNPSYGAIHGRLYDWYTAGDSNTWPEGWRLPTYYEMQPLQNIPGGNAALLLGGSTGFDANLSGYFWEDGGTFHDLNHVAYFWVGQNSNDMQAIYLELDPDQSLPDFNWTIKTTGLSVRLIKE